MSAGLNKVILIGRLGTDPELRHTQSNQPLARMRIATTEVYNDRSGQRQENTEWHTVVSWGRSAEVVSRYLKKGRQVYVEGRLQTRKWQDKEGRDRWTTEVIAQKVLFLGGKGDSVDSPMDESGPPPGGGDDVQDPFASDFDSSGGDKPSSDDDLPF
ncbi:MAG: single-stranded DNA-binding protein [Pseudomonadota bacterium]